VIHDRGIQCDEWRDRASGETLKSCTIIVTEPNANIGAEMSSAVMWPAGPTLLPHPEQMGALCPVHRGRAPLRAPLPDTDGISRTRDQTRTRDGLHFVTPFQKRRYGCYVVTVNAVSSWNVVTLTPRCLPPCRLPTASTGRSRTRQPLRLGPSGRWTPRRHSRERDLPQVGLADLNRQLGRPPCGPKPPDDCFTQPPPVTALRTDRQQLLPPPPRRQSHPKDCRCKSTGRCGC
jgi:hypothetical protein